MPELPEVETMVRGLRPALEGARLREAEALDPFLLEGGLDGETFGRVLRGATVARVGRRGKWVVWELGGSRGVVVIQPRMTGGFRLGVAERPAHARFRFEVSRRGVSGGGVIWMTDARRLGRVAWHAGREEAEAAFRRSQGPDALEIGRAELGDRLSGTSRAIKPTLMDQKVLAGVGNIYADEILFEARIHPERSSRELSSAEVDRIHAAISSVLVRAIAAEGSSFDAGYRTVLGLEGGFLAENAMYGRAGSPCPGCGSPVLRERIAGLTGRSTYYCPVCQPRGPGSG